ncbi:unnamed protein product [Paramecium sonneborni]|uniref:Myb-like DNA-binding domain containing protein n=1 Tax=Paramecium sonneborni TaxID=65129 RepID=A0A8S1R7Z4_9CILI|nr:unnamed protein product [Paramecium sonneborni]
MRLQSKSGEQILKNKAKNDKESYKKKEFSISLRKKWSLEEDKKLTTYTTLYGHHWLKVAQQMEERNASQCCQRWKRIKKCLGFKPNKAKRWTQNEDDALLRIFKEIGPQWNAIARQMKIKTGKQVRRRYKNFLDPNLNHGPINEAEDERIFQNYLKYGSQWSKIAQEMPGRSENMVKNRFYSYIKEKYLNQPNLYFKVKPLDQENLSKGSNIFHQFKHESQEQRHLQDIFNDSNEIVDNNQSSFFWNQESKAQIHYLFK